MLLFAAAAVALGFPANAAAGSGGSFTASFTSTPPTIDGSLTDSAWASATAYPLTFGTIPATVRFLRDDTNLYVGVDVQDPAAGSAPLLSTFFDNGNNGSTDVGDDAWLAEVGTGEDFYSSDTTGSAYVNDLTAGGTNDTTAAVGFASGSVSFETKHPLCSADLSHDVCISTPGQLVGVDFQYEPGTTPGLFYDAPGDRTTQGTWADFTVPPAVRITSPAAGSDLSGNVTVSASASAGVTSIDFKEFDGATQQFHDIGTDTTAPFSVTFDSDAVPNCEHMNCTIYATALDTSGNSTTIGNGVGIANPIVIDTASDTSVGCSLRLAIASANDNAADGSCKNGLSSITDTIDVPAGTYDLSASLGGLAISSDMNIVGSGARTTLIRGFALGQRVLTISPGNVEIKSVTIAGGSSSRSGPGPNAGVGGGIWVDSNASLTLQDSSVTGNEADISGGGIDTDGPLTVIRSTIENNSTGTGGFGAGIDDFGPSMSITNSTIAGNSAQANGGGLEIGGTATLKNVTVANNKAGFNVAGAPGTGGGIHVSGTPAITLVNTLLAGNTQHGGGLNECSGPLTSGGHNLSDDQTCDFTTAGDLANTNPLLGQVDSNGPTDVLPLTSGSPAINAGDDTACPAIDQLGTARPQGSHCDIGAVEFVGTGGSLSGSVDQSIVQPVDVTAAGPADWAVWAQGLTGPQPASSLAPTDYKVSGGREISDLTITNGDGTTPTRGFGTDGTAPFTFSWGDGTPTVTASSVLAGLTAPAVGQGLSFTVPASTTPRTLTIWTSSHYADGKLTASLSDGSAPDFQQTIHAVQGDFTDSGENVPAIFTLDYHAASAGQHLTVTWTQATNNGCPGCDDIVLYAAALAGGGNTTSASASLSTGPAVQMSGSNDAIADIPLSAFEVTPSGVTPAPINGLPINGLPINGLPINGLPINGLPINGLPINGLPINGLPINGLPINGLPINGLPINGLPINGLPINGLEIPGGWAAVLAGTPLADKPLQTITLQQVLALDPLPSAVRNLTLGDLELANSQLGQMTIGALALGSTPINGLGSESSTIEQQLQAWCEGAVTSGDPGTDCSLASIGNQSLFALGLAGAPINGLPINGLPINGLPINGLPINGLPINGLDLSASPINGLPINGLPINGLPINGLPALTLSEVVDCSKVDCATATLGDAAAAGAIVPGATYGDLLRILLADGSPVQSTLTLGDVIGLLIKRADVPWETLPPRLLSVFDPERPTLSASASFTLQGSGTPSADVQLRIPEGFDFDPGSATLTEGSGDPQPLADPTVDGGTLDWQIDTVDPDHTYTIGFRLRSGTTVGPAQVTETVTSGAKSDTSVAAFSVDDSYPSSGDPSEAPSIEPNDGVQMSALASPGAVDYYTIPMPAAGTRIQVHLTNLPADYDLALYSSRTTSVRTGSTTAPPLQDAIVSDPQIDLAGGSNGQLTPTALRDIPDPGIPVVQVSANRGTDDEDVGMVSPGGGGSVTIAVFGYNGAFSPQPYSLRVKAVAPPPTETCDARSFPHLGQGTTPDPLPSISGLPANLNTIILVDEKRLGDTYGSDAAHTTDGRAGESEALAALHSLAGDASLGVSGVVVPVEQIPGVQSLYDAWDSNPCDPDAANAVANAIADEVAAIKAARPSVQYVVFGGGDDQIPFFRLPDLSLIANESGFAGQFGPNEYSGSLGAGDLLSDNPYLDTRPIPASGRQLFIPDLVGGRLVESTGDIAGAVTSFESSGGVLRSSTGFVSGYDFVADGSHAVANRLTSLGVNVQTLIDDTNPFVPSLSWTKAGLLSAAFPSGGAAAINDWNGHYDNTRAEMANGDILSTGDLTGANALNGGLFFTMGCHAGFQTTDAVVGSSVLDWPQYFAQHNTGFVGNTGFGLGNTDSVAFSEDLMADFAGELGGSVTLGQALTQAKQQYYLSRVAFSNYDEKTLSEAELYGLPMYGVGQAPASLLAAATPSPDPVSGTTSSTSPSQGMLSSFPGNSVQAASFAATPHFVGPVRGQDGDYYTNDGQVQAPNYRPLQPYVSLPAARSGLVAHGVVVDSLTSQDHTGFDPDNVRPTLDLSANEPEPQFTDEAWPEKIPTLVSLGSDQSLNLITGQFFTQASSSTSGVERLWTQLGGRVTYSTSRDFTPPTIDSIDAFLSNGVVGFTGRFSDLDENGAPASVVFAQVVYDDGAGNWLALPLQLDSTSGIWSGGAPFSEQHIQYFVEACDAAGNCGYSSNKGRYFDAQPLPPSGGALTLAPSRTPDTGAWYTGSLNVDAISAAPIVTASVDGGPFSPVGGPLTISGDGAHVVQARDSDGNTATAVYLVDTTAPTIGHTIAPAAPNGTNGWYVTRPTVTFGCADNLSGVHSCLVDGGTSSSTMLGEGGSQGASATAIDNAGHSSHDSLTGVKVDVTAPANITFSGIEAKLYPVNSLPASSAISCSATDSGSGFDRCLVTGYGNDLGLHTLTATAYDKAGNQRTATLTYTVGFQSGDILAPVTAKNGDQTNPLATDLQVFKIKSIVPIKFQFYLDAAKTTLLTTPPAGSVAKLTVAKFNSSTASTDTTDLVTGSADSGNLFRWSGSPDYQYVYNMATSKLTAGTYYVVITLYASDGTTVLGQSVKQYFVLRS